MIATLFEQLTQNPVNWVLLLGATYIAYSYFNFEPENIPPPQHPETVVFKIYTPKELAEFDGIKSSRILMGVNGKVYDVTSGKKFYGPDGPYGNFAGHDASRGLAKHSFDEEMLTPLDQPIDTLSDLTEEEWGNLKGWDDTFSSKYLHVGTLVNEKN
ncbi:putative sterol metabolism-related protein [Basidiobolus meristosporus CBS 931.73]|uniref:Putative sterol metabolism-related protein n=1 Tax=Basidiobolus meristosporus CBS 931.73 TaxID=1314790 RepID=A0A1Y1YSZ0_9FUNG|nr:putative sterol metabolism-related protein [Basidiobolus meristosporus CBS 931.73]|eukprot:ORY01152.1 putative sterol metabolism-related protein [Basidiobolus meristosporus CBS 931.73]